MSAPFYSIIIPTYNSEKHIVPCCLSVINQTWSDYEILIQDGLSSDATLALIQNLEQLHPRVSMHVFSESDGGIYDAMNKAIANAAGNWLLFLGSDDQLYNDEVLSNVSVTLKDTSAKMVYGNALLDGRSKWADNITVYDGPFSLAKLFERNICHQSIFYHRSLFGQIGNYNTRYVVCADWDFNLRCYARVEVKYIDQIIARFSGAGLSNIGTDAFKDESIFLLKDYFKIGYYNKLFKNHSWTFLHQAIEASKKSAFSSAFNFLMLSFFHAKNKLFLARVVVKKLLQRIIPVS